MEGVSVILAQGVEDGVPGQVRTIIGTIHNQHITFPIFFKSLQYTAAVHYIRDSNDLSHSIWKLWGLLINGCEFQDGCLFLSKFRGAGTRQISPQVACLARRRCDVLDDGRGQCRS